MDASAPGASSVKYHNTREKMILPLATPPETHHRQQRHCFGNAIPGEFPLSDIPTIVIHFLSAYNLGPQDHARLEATCSLFRHPAGFDPYDELSLAELAALHMCEKRTIFKSMTVEQRECLKQRCGGSWKLVLRYLLAGESCSRREKSQAIAGPGHSVVVTSNGAVYSFGGNSFGQLGHGSTNDEPRPRLIRSLCGVRITHATAGNGRTMLISDEGRVYAFGRDIFGDVESGHLVNDIVTAPRLVESLKDIFVVEATIGNFFTAVLSRQGRIYTFSWGDEHKLGHQSEPNDLEPRPLLGALENVPVVQISAGFCYLLALACQPGGRMSVYSVGCGLGGKLGHGTKTDEKQPRLIEQFLTLNLEPVAIAAGTWHAVVLGKDGRVCTWGWGRYGCLGHGTEDYQLIPKVVESLSNVKAVHVAAGDYTTFVVSDAGHAYSFGCGQSSSLGLNTADDEQQGNRSISVLRPELVTSLKQMKERVVHVSLTKSIFWDSHTFALTDTGKVYAFGSGGKGQLGVELAANQMERAKPERVDVSLG